MNHLGLNRNAPKVVAILSGVLLLGNCGQMSQQKAGHTGAAIGAVAGGLGMGALAKKNGARGGDVTAATIFGGLGGAAIGNALGQQTGTRGVYKTEVPNE